MRKTLRTSKTIMLCGLIAVSGITASFAVPVPYAYASSGYFWQTIAPEGASDGQATSPKLINDPNGVPYVAFQDDSLGNKVTVMRYKNGSWEAVGQKGFSAGIASTIAFAMDSNGTPYVA